MATRRGIPSSRLAAPGPISTEAHNVGGCGAAAREQSQQMELGQDRNDGSSSTWIPAATNLRGNSEMQRPDWRPAAEQTRFLGGRGRTARKRPMHLPVHVSDSDPTDRMEAPELPAPAGRL